MSRRKPMKHQRQRKEYHRVRTKLIRAESLFRKDVQRQLQTRIERLRLKCANTNANDEPLVGIEQLVMTDDLRGQLRKIQKLRKAMKLDTTTPREVACGLSMF